MTQDFCFESFECVAIILCGKEVYSILELGEILRNRMFQRFIYLLFAKQLLGFKFCDVLFVASSSSIVLNHSQCVRQNCCSNLACLI